MTSDPNIREPSNMWSSAALMATIGGGVIPYLFSHYMKGKKGMTALENALINLMAPLIDTLRAVEKDRDAERAKNDKLSGEVFDARASVAKLQDEIADLRVVKIKDDEAKIKYDETICDLRGRLERSAARKGRATASTRSG